MEMLIETGLEGFAYGTDGDFFDSLDTSALPSAGFARDESAAPFAKATEGKQDRLASPQNGNFQFFPTKLKNNN